MNHTFVNKGDTTCAKCGRNEIDHTDSAQCEACPTIGSCEILGTMLLCASCYDHDKQLEDLNAPEANDRETRITQLTNRLAREIPSDRRMYFVGRITAIVDIEQELSTIPDMTDEDRRFKLAQIVEANLITLKARLTEKHLEIRELQGESVADQKYLNQIVPQLRAEEREKFKSYDINYKPNVVVAPTSGASKPRMSASDKAMESFAKIMGISVEQARISMNNAVKNVTGAVCSCATTPGFCKVHPK